MRLSLYLLSSLVYIYCVFVFCVLLLLLGVKFLFLCLGEKTPVKKQRGGVVDTNKREEAEDDEDDNNNNEKKIFVVFFFDALLLLLLLLFERVLDNLRNLQSRNDERATGQIGALVETRWEQRSLLPTTTTTKQRR